jgi:capsular polysaccharide biosynthesis protein
MNAQFEFSRLEKANLRAHYEELAVNSLQSVVRHRWLIAKLIAGALVLAALLVSVLPRKYTAEALVQAQLFARGETVSTTALASIDSASIVASEAHLIQSQAIARAVVKRLGLDSSHEFAAPTSLLGRVTGVVRSAIFPETALSEPLERATRNVRAKLTVTRDTRSYVISIAFTATSPEAAANIANAFAIEYFNAKLKQRLSEAVAAATRELAQRSAIYGEKHPSYIRAVADLQAARQRLQAALDATIANDVVAGEGVTLAEPNSAPSSPNGSAILGLAFVGALVFGMGLAVWLDRQDKGLRTEGEVLTCTGVRCLGLVPNLNASVHAPGVVEALRTVAGAAGLIDAEGPTTVAIVSSTEHDGSASLFSAGLAGVLGSPGRRVLLVDTLSQRRQGDRSVSLDEIASAKDRAQAFNLHSAGQPLILRPSVAGAGQAVDTQRMKRLLAEARSYFDIIIVAIAQPALSETVALARSADSTLLLAQWGSTPQRVVTAATRQLREGAVHVSGVVLTEVDAHASSASPPQTGAGLAAPRSKLASHARLNVAERVRSLGGSALQPVHAIWRRRAELAPLAVIARIRQRGVSQK